MAVPRARFAAPERINYLDVQLAAGERWIYQPPLGHEVAWLAVSARQLCARQNPSPQANWSVFEESNDALVIQADSCVEVCSRFGGQTSARLGARPLLGSHDSVRLFVAGESEIQRIGNQLAAAGLLR